MSASSRRKPRGAVAKEWKGAGVAGTENVRAMLLPIPLQASAGRLTPK